MDLIGGGWKPIVMHCEFLGHDNSQVAIDQFPLSFYVIVFFFLIRKKENKSFMGG